MFAIIKTGGKQCKVEEGAQLAIEKLAGDVGSNVQFSEVLFVGGNGKPVVGAPLVAGANVTAEIVRQAKDKKVLVYKKKRRKGYEKKRGHRQHFTEVKITKINA